MSTENMEESKKKYSAQACVRILRRARSHPTKMFGSNVQHSNPISLSIMEASVEAGGLILPGKCIVEVEMSLAQWAGMLTSVNWANTPCTLLSVAGAEVAKYDPQPSALRKEVDTVLQNMQERRDRGRESRKRVTALLAKKSLSRGDCHELGLLFGDLDRSSAENFDYQVERFSELAERVLVARKAELSAYVAHLTTACGVSESDIPAALMEVERRSEEREASYTREPPKVPGAYWIVVGGRPPEIVQVELHYGELGTWRSDGKFERVSFADNVFWSALLVPPPVTAIQGVVDAEGELWTHEAGTPYPPFAPEDLAEICKQHDIKFNSHCSERGMYVGMSVAAVTGALSVMVSCEDCEMVLSYPLRKLGGSMREDILAVLLSLRNVWNASYTVRPVDGDTDCI